MRAAMKMLLTESLEKIPRKTRLALRVKNQVFYLSAYLHLSSHENLID